MAGHVGLIGLLEAFLAPNSSAVPSELCRNHSSVFLDFLHNGTLWAYKMWDASAKMQAGLLTGNMHSLGSYDECLGVSSAAEDYDGKIAGKYCLAKFKMKDGIRAMGSIIRNVTYQDEALYSEMESLLSRGLRWGFCIPSVCNATDLRLGLIDHLGDPHGLEVLVEETDCNFDDYLKPVDIIIAMLFVYILMFVVMSTFVEWRRDQCPANRSTNASSEEIHRGLEGQGVMKNLASGDNTHHDSGKAPKVFETFSLINNCKHLFSLEDCPERLKSLDGLKVMSLLWVLLGNACLVTFSLPAMNYFYIRKYVNEWPALLILNSHLAADTFLVCSGILVAYNFLIDMERRGLYRRDEDSLNIRSLQQLCVYIPRSYVHRYLRLTPALAAVVFYKISFFRVGETGPFWRTGTQELKEGCKNSWWRTLLYVQNYSDGDKMCLPHSWYMMVDMQLTILVTPVILAIFLYKKKELVVLLSSFVVAVSVIVTLTINYKSSLPAGIIVDDLWKWHEKATEEFIKMHVRVSPWLIGMVTGYFLYHYKLQEIRSSIMGWPCILFGWMLAAFLSILAVFGQHFCQHNILWSAVYNALQHSAWAFGISWIIYMCETNHAGPLYDLFSLRIFLPLRRLTYCIYLVHLPLLARHALSVRTPIYVDQMSWVNYFLGNLLHSTVYATILALSVEVPMSMLYKACVWKFGLPFRYNPQTQTASQSLKRRSRNVRMESIPEIILQTPVTSVTIDVATPSSSTVSSVQNPVFKASSVGAKSALTMPDCAAALFTTPDSEVSLPEDPKESTDELRPRSVSESQFGTPKGLSEDEDYSAYATPMGFPIRDKDAREFGNLLGIKSKILTEK